jgi:hypothetical protein
MAHDDWAPDLSLGQHSVTSPPYGIDTQGPVQTRSGKPKIVSVIGVSDW